jgi:hypothetical protein
MKYYALLLFMLALLTGALCPSASLALTQTVSAKVRFVSPLTLTALQPLDFGNLKASQAGSYTLSTAGTVSASSGGELISGAPSAGSITLSGSATQTIKINVTSYSPPADGVALTDATCNYNNSGEVPCNDDKLSNVALTKPENVLKIGATLITDNTSTEGKTATPSMTISIMYN